MSILGTSISSTLSLYTLLTLFTLQPSQTTLSRVAFVSLIALVTFNLRPLVLFRVCAIVFLIVGVNTDIELIDRTIKRKARRPSFIVCPSGMHVRGTSITPWCSRCAQFSIKDISKGNLINCHLIVINIGGNGQGHSIRHICPTDSIGHAVCDITIQRPTPCHACCDGLTSLVQGWRD